MDIDDLGNWVTYVEFIKTKIKRTRFHPSGHVGPPGLWGIPHWFSFLGFEKIHIHQL